MIDRAARFRLKLTQLAAGASVESNLDSKYNLGELAETWKRLAENEDKLNGLHDDNQR
jgi:hypothetical protein